MAMTCGWNLDPEKPTALGACGKPAQNVLPVHTPAGVTGQAILCDEHLPPARDWLEEMGAGHGC